MTNGDFLRLISRHNKSFHYLYFYLSLILVSILIIVNMAYSTGDIESDNRDSIVGLNYAFASIILILGVLSFGKQFFF